MAKKAQVNDGRSHSLGHAASKKVTMLDVAQRAGVSYQTVSRVLNNPDKVSPNTRKKIDEAIAELKYVPNMLAQQLGKSERNVIGIINVPRAIHPATSVLSPLKKLADSRGYKVMIMVIDVPSYDSLRQCLSELQSQMVNKILINAPLSTEPAMQLCAEFPDCKIVFLDVDPICPVLNVCFNSYDGTAASMRYLSELGHKKIALIRGPKGQVTSDLRYDSWIKCAASLNMEIVAEAEGDWSSQSGFDCMTKLLDHCREFTALVAGNDEMALGAQAVLHKYGLRVPQDISIIGYDDIVDSAFFLPPLTSISLDRNRQIELAFHKLIGSDNTSSVLSTNLVVRSSCAPVSGGNGVDFRDMAEAMRKMALQLEMMQRRQHP